MVAWNEANISKEGLSWVNNSSVSLWKSWQLVQVDDPDVLVEDGVRDEAKWWPT